MSSTKTEQCTCPVADREAAGPCPVHGMFQIGFVAMVVPGGPPRQQGKWKYLGEDRRELRVDQADSPVARVVEYTVDLWERVE